MMVRFFAEVDDTSEESRFALTYLRALVALRDAVLERTRIEHMALDQAASRDAFAIRLIPITVAMVAPDEKGREVSRWAVHRQLLGTPLESEFVNVVCCKDAQRFWTRGARNVVIASDRTWCGGAQWDAVVAPAGDPILGAWHVSDGPRVVGFGPGSPLGVLYDVLFPS